jgi:hypothetical protein
MATSTCLRGWVRGCERVDRGRRSLARWVGGLPVDGFAPGTGGPTTGTGYFTGYWLTCKVERTGDFWHCSTEQLRLRGSRLRRAGQGEVRARTRFATRAEPRQCVELHAGSSCARSERRAGSTTAPVPVLSSGLVSNDIQSRPSHSVAPRPSSSRPIHNWPIAIRACNLALYGMGGAFFPSSTTDQPATPPTLHISKIRYAPFPPRARQKATPNVNDKPLTRHRRCTHPIAR